MEDIIKISEAEYNQRLNDPDKEKALGFINDYMSGKVGIVSEEEAVSAQEPVSEPVETAVSTEIQTEQQTDNYVPENNASEHNDEEKRILREEIERRQRLVEETERKAREEREKLLLEMREKERKLEEMKRMHEQASQSAFVRNSQTANADTATEADDDLEFASEATVKTRKMVQDLEAKINKLSGNTDFRAAPEYAELKQLLDEQKEQKRLDAERKAKEESERKSKLLFDEIKKVQEEVPEELKTETPIEALDKEYIEFKKKLASTFGAANMGQAELLAQEYLNGKSAKAEEIRKKSQALGIAPPKEVEKYVRISALVDLKNGYEFDPVSGEYKQILDDFGQPVRYRNVSEAYKVASYYDRINRARVDATKEIQQKLEERQNTAVTIGQQSSNIDSAEELTEDRAYGLIEELSGNTVAYRKAMSDPNTAPLVIKAFAKFGLTPPQLGF